MIEGAKGDPCSSQSGARTSAHLAENLLSRTNKQAPCQSLLGNWFEEFKTIAIVSRNKEWSSLIMPNLAVSRLLLILLTVYSRIQKRKGRANELLAYQCYLIRRSWDHRHWKPERNAVLANHNLGSLEWARSGRLMIRYCSLFRNGRWHNWEWFGDWVDRFYHPLAVSAW